MPVKEADPRAADLDGAFAAAMGAPPKPKEPAAPPEIDHEAPHGRDDDGQPLAPHGYNKDGSVRKSAAGRKSKDDQARTAPAAAPGAEVVKGKAKPEPRNYVPALTETADAAWMILSVGGKVGPELPLIGRYLPGPKLAAQAALFKMHQDGLIGAVQYASQHSAAAARWAARLEQGEITWSLMFGFMVMPFVVQSATMWKAGQIETGNPEMPAVTAAKLAEQNDQDLDLFMSKMAQQFADASVMAEGAAAAGANVSRETAAGKEGLNGQHA